MRWQAFGDWGTSHLRLYRIEGETIAGKVEGRGIGNLGAAPEAVLRDALSRLAPGSAPEQIRLCGMAGARGGFVEAGYIACPASARDWAAGASSLTLDGIPLRVGAGLAFKDAAGTLDVMRGEEAQIFGAWSLDPAAAQGKAMFVLPGTHSKWVYVEDGRVNGFRTFLSGELFALLKAHSTLLAPGEAGADEDEDAGFAAGLDRAEPADGSPAQGLAGNLFATRSQQLRAGRSHRWAGGYLSGLIIGDEISSMRRLGLAPRSLTLIGAPVLCARYERALAHCGIAATTRDGETCALRGLELLGDHA